MTLSLYNTLSKRVQEFAPTVEGQVRLYTCGPTVYDHPHIGNWVAYIYWDTLVRTLQAHGYHVERVMNITDVGHLTGDNEGDPNVGEDKLEKGARREGKTAWQIAEIYTEEFMKGMENLGLLRPQHIAKATDFIPQQLELVRTLKANGYAYQITDGIYFDTSRFKSYGDFAGLNLDELRAGARVEINQEKRNISDFALWKFTPPGTKRDMEWETPSYLLEETAGQRMGFPGWHLECSAIAMNLLGNTLDIHTGGIDHIPVHHTNEIAQSEAATGEQFSRFWLHNNHMKVDGAKISKSLGNGYTLQDLRERGFHPLDFRLLALQSHYQSEGNFTFEGLEAARNRRNHWRAVAALRWQSSADENPEIDKRVEEAETGLMIALDDNLNTPDALKTVDEIFTILESVPVSRLSPSSLSSLVLTIDGLLGIGLADSTPDVSEELKARMDERASARSGHDWTASDRLRDELASHGIAIRDTAEGTLWSYID